MENENLLSLVEQRQQMVAKIAELEASKKELDAQIEKIVVSGTTHIGKWSVSVIDSDVVGFDTSKFKKENPEIASKYNKISKRHSLTIKEISATANQEQI